MYQWDLMGFHGRSIRSNQIFMVFLMGNPFPKSSMILCCRLCMFWFAPETKNFMFGVEMIEFIDFVYFSDGSGWSISRFCISWAQEALRQDPERIMNILAMMQDWWPAIPWIPIEELWVIDSELIELFPCNIISNLYRYVSQELKDHLMAIWIHWKANLAILKSAVASCVGVVARRKSTLTLRKVVLKWSRLEKFCLKIGYPKIQWFKVLFPGKHNDHLMAIQVWVGNILDTQINDSYPAIRWIFGLCPMDRPAAFVGQCDQRKGCRARVVRRNGRKLLVSQSQVCAS